MMERGLILEIVMAQRFNPTETTMELIDIKQHLSQVVKRVASGETRVVIEEGGSPVAAIISTAEYRRFTSQERELQSKRTALFETFARFSDSFAGVSDEELERELAKAQAEVRAEFRAEREAMNQD
jgi:prevent-host-death family protein